jgi:hypothetical protein
MKATSSNLVCSLYFETLPLLRNSPSISKLQPKYFTRHFTDEEKTDKWARIVAPVGDSVLMGSDGVLHVLISQKCEQGGNVESWRIRA